MAWMPLDLVASIIEEAYYNDDLGKTPDRCTLRACALVCTSWAGLAQKLLFRAVSIPSDLDRCAAFRSAAYAPSERSRILVSYIRSAHIDVGSGTPDKYNSVSDLVDLVTHCPRLYELSLRFHGVHELDNATLDALQAAQLRAHRSPIRALSLLSCGIQSPILYQLLVIWPTIQYLRVGTEIVAPPPSKPIGAKLYELTLHRTPSAEALSWLLSASKDTLRILGCHTAPPTSYDPILAEHTERLHSLRIFRHTPRTVAIIRQCTSLKELVLTQLSNFLPLGELPPTLEHISFRYFPGTVNLPLSTIISAIENLPRLSLVSCDACARENPDFPLFEAKLAEKQASLCTDVLPIRAVSAPARSQSYKHRDSIL